jgi:hypothetical protein
VVHAGVASRVSGTRITLCLPVNTAAERSAASRVIDGFNQKYGGATASRFQPATFLGFWDEGSRIIVDEIAVVMTDVDGELDDLLADLEDVRATILQAYADAGSPQLDTWVVAHRTLRIAQ